MIVFFTFDSKSMEDCLDELLSIMISVKTRLLYQRVVSSVREIYVGFYEDMLVKRRHWSHNSTNMCP